MRIEETIVERLKAIGAEMMREAMRAADTVTEIYDRLATTDPQLLLLACPLCRFTDATQFAYQDWPTWMRTGATDVVLPQIYTARSAGSPRRHRGPADEDRDDLHAARYVVRWLLRARDPARA